MEEDDVQRYLRATARQRRRGLWGMAALLVVVSVASALGAIDAVDDAVHRFLFAAQALTALVGAVVLALHAHGGSR